MCGIVGIYAYSRACDPIDRAELVRSCDYMTKRGPDGKGEWYTDDGRVGFAHRRLSIIDLSQAAAQPMVSADGMLVVTFNGEIYNFRALRQDLEKRGHVFRTQSDTEVLLHLYADKGEAMVQDLRGMFAFAIWDANKRAVLLARDPYGIKPLYYADNNGTLRFASQVKALLAGGMVSKDPDPEGWAGYYLFGSVPEPHTTYRAIRAVPAGSTIWIDAAGAREPRRYFSVSETYCQGEIDASRDNEDVQREFRDALLDSVSHHLVADVPVGAFLSGGVDSAALVGLMRDAGQKDIQTVTLSFEEFRGTDEDEAPLAERVAREYGTRHVSRVVTEREFHDDLPKILNAMDQPTIDGINTWFVSKAARELGLKVAISGLGGDELFGGYPSFREIPKWVKYLALPSRSAYLGNGFKHIASKFALISGKIHPKAAGLLKYGGDYAGAYFLRRGIFMPWELNAVLHDSVVEEGLRRFDFRRYIGEAMHPMPRTDFGKVASLESALYMRNQLLRDADWASMAHSLEVRVPLVDAPLLRRIAPYAAATQRMGKNLLAASPRAALSGESVGRRKTGFITPIEKWLQSSALPHSWKHVPALAQKNCPWARRWAYEVSILAADSGVHHRINQVGAGIAKNTQSLAAPISPQNTH